MERSVIALLHGPDQPGIVAKVAGWIHEHGGNVLHADQHLDRQENIFFQRVEWSPQPSRDLRSEADAFSSFSHEELGMKVRIALSDDQPKIAIMVSRADHCFHDLVLRVRSGEWNAKIAGVVSNHLEMRTASEGYGLDYLHLPVTKESKEQVEDQQLNWLKTRGVELVILARYMQVLSSDFLDRVGCPVINIHHSFLPFFCRSQAIPPGIPAWG
jgi:formyltetrahydrofolate deformylase